MVFIFLCKNLPNLKKYNIIILGLALHKKETLQNKGRRVRCFAISVLFNYAWKSVVFFV
jgi:hypothetical protein